MPNMRAHFITSTIELESEIHSYRLIINILKKHGVELTSNWLENAHRRHTLSDSNAKNELSWSEIYRENINAISRADIVVAEVGQKSFLVGFQVAHALQLKKPILLLSKLEKIDSVLGVSLSEDIIKYSHYTDSNVEGVIKKFISENSMDGKNIRFNFFITRKLLNYLNWVGLQTGKTKSEIIRDLIQQEMYKSDY